jgi:hypothetical protein
VRMWGHTECGDINSVGVGTYRVWEHKQCGCGDINGTDVGTYRVPKFMFEAHRLSYRCCHHHDHHHHVRKLCAEHSVDVQTADTRSSRLALQEWNRLGKLSVASFIFSRCQVSLSSTILTGTPRYSMRTLTHRYFVTTNPT